MLWRKVQDRQRAYENNTEARSRNHWCRGRTIGISVALSIQHAVRMPRIVICSLSGSTSFIFTLSQTRNDFGENAIVHKMCFLM